MQGGFAYILRFCYGAVMRCCFPLMLGAVLAWAVSPVPTSAQTLTQTPPSDEAVVQLHLNAEGDAEGQYALGWYYRDAGDVAAAVHWWREAATQPGGHRKAEFNLGVMYATGEGVAQDYRAAADWYRLAAGEATLGGADTGLANAQYNLGKLYYDGLGVARNYSEAVKWFGRAGKQGYLAAQFNLGLMYRLGQGVLADAEAAADWYQLAADQNFAPAQYRLGVMYASGEGVGQNFITAYMWFSLAAAGGDADASGELDGLVEFMGDDEVLAAQRLAREYFR